MKKYIIGSIILIVLAIGIYYGRYFVFDTEVNEQAPTLITDSQEQAVTMQGSFIEVDRVHKGSGKAILVEKGDERVLRFENFEVTNGPDLYVWLTKSEKPTSDIESLGEYIDLGKLKGNIGNQNYTINQNIDGHDTVVIWCKQFSQLFSYANLE